MPISFLSEETKGEIADYCFGRTLDVSSCGVCVSARPDHIPDVNTRMMFLVRPERQGRQSQSDVSVTIHGKVIWKNIEK